MNSLDEEEPDYSEILSRMALPENPSEAMELAGNELALIKTWKRPQALALVAGMLTDVRYHSHVIRLDWLARLILAYSEGGKKPKRKDLTVVLNKGFGASRVTSLEDPIEGFFTEAVPTSRGDMMIFEGHWEGAAQYTETVIRAFERLPPALEKERALTAVYALLRLSTCVAERSGAQRRSYNEGSPQKSMVLPSDERLQFLARRVRFTIEDLNALGISLEDIQPYILSASQFEGAADKPAGSSAIDFFPLMLNDSQLIVINPGAISLAVRSTLLNTAISGGVGVNLIARLAEVQEAFALSTGFWPGSELRLSPMTRKYLRASVVGFAPGRYLHVIQVMPDPASFASAGFGGMLSLGDGAEDAIGEDIAKFWEFLEAQQDCREAISVVLISGWGGWIAINPKIQEERAPQNWQYVAISFADAATMGACEDGRLRDLRRIQEQLQILEGVGYDIQRMNGTINLFGNWRDTEANFIPEHWDADPPAMIFLPQDGLLKPRIEGEANRDVRSVQLPNGSFEIVQRAEWNQDGDLKPIYGSLEGIKAGRLIGVVYLDERAWWIEIEDEDAKPDREWQFQVWNSVVQWLGISAPTLIKTFPGQLTRQPCRIRIIVRGSDSSHFNPMGAAEGHVRNHIELGCDDGQNFVRLKSGWTTFLSRVDNDAEFALASAVVEQIAQANGKALLREDIESCLRKAVPSTDWRYLHAFEARYPLDRLTAGGFYPRFRRITRSASALVRCGTVWRFWDRTNGSEFNGEDECRDFLQSYYDFVLRELIAQIRAFNRESLLYSCALAYGAARSESDRWKRSIRAMRSIHGPEIDQSALARGSECNAVQRAAKAICEIGSCEAQPSGGAEPSNEDLDEMFARALLLFGNGQLYATIRGGLVKPHLKISPAGDLLSDRSIFEKTFLPSSAKAHEIAMNEASESYVDRFATKESSEQDEGKLTWSPEFRSAVTAEYHCTPEAFVDFQMFVVGLCEEAGEGVLIMRRSELGTRITDNPDFPDRDITQLLERLTLNRRDDWTAKPQNYSARDLELWRFDRRYSTVSRPLIAISDDVDPMIMVSPIFVSDATMYQLSALHFATIHNDSFWESKEAKAYAGARAKEIGEKFEDEVAERLNQAGLSAVPRKKITALLDKSTSDDLGDVDVFVTSRDGRHVIAIEAKSLKLCRTEAEVAARMTDYAGRMRKDDKGREKPDKLMRHLTRVNALRDNAQRLGAKLGLEGPPKVHGLVVFEAPQPMSFFMLEEVKDAASCIAEDVVKTVKSMTR